MEREEIRCIVSGKVQGVMYRDYIARHARHFALTGFVRNVPDFKVEIVAQGYPDALEKFLAYARRGPFLARVSRLDMERREQGELFGSFDIVF
jgi:acylphosphatase